MSDIKIYLRWIYEMVCTGVKENRVVAADVMYLENQMGCHKSRIDDNDRDLHKLMGKMDIIKVDVQKLISMNQCSHCRETLGYEDHQMEETSVVQSVRGIKGKKK